MWITVDGNRIGREVNGVLSPGRKRILVREVTSNYDRWVKESFDVILNWKESRYYCKGNLTRER